MKRVVLIALSVFLFTFLGPGVSMATLIFSSVVIDDDNTNNSIGNNDGIADPGETAELYVYLKNTGAANIYNVIATISTSDPNISFIFNTTSSYTPNPIMPDGFGTIGDDFDVTIASTTPIGHIINFNLDIAGDVASGIGSLTPATWTDSFSITVGSQVPIPAAAYLLGAGFVGLAGLRRKLKK